jgi:hypothetical protein
VNKISVRTQYTIQNVPKHRILTDQTYEYNSSCIYKFKAYNVSCGKSCKREEHSVLDETNALTPSEATTAIPDFQTTY